MIDTVEGIGNMNIGVQRALSVKTINTVSTASMSTALTSSNNNRNNDTSCNNRNNDSMKSFLARIDLPTDIDETQSALTYSPRPPSARRSTWTRIGATPVLHRTAAPAGTRGAPRR